MKFMLKKENNISKDHLVVLLESMDSKLNGLVEGHSHLNKKIDKNHQEFVEFKEEMIGFKSEMIGFKSYTESNFKTVFKYLSNY